MYCLKCGNETENDQVFCRHCLETMEKYPVKPGTPAKIPHRENAAAYKKQNRRKNINLEDQLIRLKVAVRTLLALFGAALIALGIFIWLYFGLVGNLPDDLESDKGTNYQVVDQNN